MPVVNPPVANPYTSQLKGFTSGIGNARRGLLDLYKLRRQGIERHDITSAKLYGAAVNATDKSYGASTKALESFAQGGLDLVGQSGYQTDDAGVARAVGAIVNQGVAPTQRYLASEHKATDAWYRGYKGAEHYEDVTLKTGLAREKPAALSELEQGILDTQSNLQTQATAFNQQQAYNASMASFQNQMLGYQRQIAQGASGMGGGGTGKETPNTAQWMAYGQQRWGVTVGGFREHGSVPNSDHPKGRAADFMSSGSLAQSIANDFVANASSRGVTYVIVNRRIWTPSQGWHAYSGPNPHTDHVHVSFAY